MSSLKRGSGLDPYLNSPLFGAIGASASTPGADRELQIQRMYEHSIAELAMNRFKWENLPESVDPRFLELQLLIAGIVVWYYDDKFEKLVVVQGAGTGYINFNQNPISYTVMGPGTKLLNADDSSLAFEPKILSAYIPQVDFEKPEEKLMRKAVGMWGNYLRYPDIDKVTLYSSRLATIERTLEINSKNARRTKVVTSTMNNQLSMTNISRQQDEGVEVINVKEGAGIGENITAIDLGILPDQYDKLSILRTRWWNECMNLLGIDNANQDKKERLVAAEVGANDAQTDSMRYVALNSRRYYAEQINHVFGQNITVDFNTEVEKQAQEMAEAMGINDGASV
jgi:hypothetical protein